VILALEAKRVAPTVKESSSSEPLPVEGLDLAPQGTELPSLKTNEQTCQIKSLRNFEEEIPLSYLAYGVYPTIPDFDPDTLMEMHTPDWVVTQGSNFANSEVIQDFVAKGIPPGERASKLMLNVSDLVSTGDSSLASLFSVYVELSHRQKYDDLRMKMLYEEIRRLRENNKNLQSQHEKIKTNSEEKNRKLTQRIEELEANLIEMNSLQTKLTDCAVSLGKKEEDIDQLAREVTRLHDDVDRLTDDRRWLISHGIPYAIGNVLESPEYLKALGNLNKWTDRAGYYEGRVAGWNDAKKGVSLDDDPHYHPDARSKRDAAEALVDDVEPSILNQIVALADADFVQIRSLLDAQEVQVIEGEDGITNLNLGELVIEGS